MMNSSRESHAEAGGRVLPSREGASRGRNILGISFNLIGYSDVLTTITSWRCRGERHYITLTPPHSVILCHRDRQLRQATDRAGLILPDGTGIILAARLLGYAHCGRVTGPTLMLKLCDGGCAQGFRHFFYGGQPGVADRLAERLRAQFSRLTVAGTCCPPFRPLTAAEDAAMVRQINRCHPDIVWVGLGSPKQEKWMAEHVGRIEAAALIGVGAAFDFHSGHVRWAPAWVRKAGLEWAYRLTREPRRMWRRNLSSVVFLAQVLRQRFAHFEQNAR
jgi:N-acetylglucosaminyldiphosphoundecaprenol N-acetyl-beta-D-mannosaminyltransferase